MLQRIQTLLMALIVVFTFSLFFVPIYVLKKELLTARLDVFGTTIEIVGKPLESHGSFLIAIVAGLGIAITSYAIFSFKNRPLQLKLGLLNTLIYLSMLGLMIYAQNSFLDDFKVGGTYGFGFFVPAICLILNMISSKFIRRDEKTVKDAFERLR